MDIWPVVHAERKALAADLRGLDAEAWTQPSLCGDWTVRDVLAHMTAGASLSPPAFFGQLVGSGFSFGKVQEKGVAAQRGASPADTLANFESVLTSVKHPPGPTVTSPRTVVWSKPQLAFAATTILLESVTAGKVALHLIGPRCCNSRAPMSTARPNQRGLPARSRAGIPGALLYPASTAGDRPLSW